MAPFVPAKPTNPRKAPTFKPPRPSTSKSTTGNKTKSAPRRKSAPARALSSSPTPSESSATPFSPSQQAIDDETSPSQSNDPPPTIPPALLTRLLHHHFQNPKTKMGTEARAVAGKYMETFVREAIARAAHERHESRIGTANGKDGGGIMADDFLEVEDLEKGAPQLILDF